MDGTRGGRGPAYADALLLRGTRQDTSYSLLADPHGTIAQGFGLGDGSGNAAPPAWFVVGGDGKIRACGHGSLHANALAAAALEAMGVTPPPVEPPSAAN